MSNLWIPGAVHKPLPINQSRDPFIIPVGPIFHVAVSEADSLFGGFRARTDGIESTGYIRRDGTIEQYRPLNVECDANGDGNSWISGGKRYGFTSWETQGGEFGEWSDAQVASIKQIILHHHSEFATPLQLAPAWNKPGVGYHRLYPQWNHNGHTCPGPDRIKQFNRVVVPWMRASDAPKEKPMNKVQSFRAAIAQAIAANPIPADRRAARAMVAAIQTALKVGPKA